MYSLEALTLTDKVLHKIDAVFYRLLRRCIGIKASFYSRISNQDVWKQGGEPTPPSKLLNSKQKDLLGSVFLANTKDPVHSIMFCSAYKDRILTQGKRKGRKCPYWLVEWLLQDTILKFGRTTTPFSELTLSMSLF